MRKVSWASVIAAVIATMSLLSAIATVLLESDDYGPSMALGLTAITLAILATKE